MAAALRGVLWRAGLVLTLTARLLHVLPCGCRSDEQRDETEMRQWKSDNIKYLFIYFVLENPDT